MNLTAPTVRKMRRGRVALIIGVAGVVLAAALFEFGLVFECEYPLLAS